MVCSQSGELADFAALILRAAVTLFLSSLLGETGDGNFFVRIPGKPLFFPRRQVANERGKNYIAA